MISGPPRHRATAPPRRLARIGEHVQLGRHAKHERLRKCVAEGVRVCIDQPAEQGLPTAVHRRCTGGSGDLGRDRVAMNRAARGCFAAHFPSREAIRSQVLADEDDHVVVAAYQRHIRPSNAPTFFTVGKAGYAVALVDDDLRYRPKGLK